jgi:hypothetical protein
MKDNQKLLIGLGLGVLALYLFNRKNKNKQQTSVSEDKIPQSITTPSKPSPIALPKINVIDTNPSNADVELQNAIKNKYGVSYGGNVGDKIVTSFGTYEKTRVNLGGLRGRAFTTIWKKVS